MSDACPNCGKPILPTDTACWYCGYTLPRKAAKPAAAAKPSGRPRPSRAARGRPATAASSTEPPVAYDFRALAIYGSLTLVVILSLWLVMSALGRRPILVRSVFDLGSDWVSVTDSELRYTVNLPPDWQWLDVAFRDQDETLERLVAAQRYIGRALRPLGEDAADLEIIGVGLGTRTPESGEPATFLVIGRSPGLRQLTPEAALDLLGARRPDASEAAVDTHVPGQPQARFTLLDAAANYQCRHLFVADAAAAGYLLAACAPQSEFGNRDRDLQRVLDSFQLLQP